MPLCPYCFNNPPFEGMRKGKQWLLFALEGSCFSRTNSWDCDTFTGEGCTSCLHPECPHSVVSNGICSCIECDSGVLVVDRTK